MANPLNNWKPIGEPVNDGVIPQGSNTPETYL